MSAPRRGFTLLELSVVLVVMLLLFILSPDVINNIQGPRKIRAAVDIGALAGGLWGINEDSNGAIGDIGLPASTPTSLNLATTLTLPATGEYAYPTDILGVTGGWEGPYIGASMKNNINDAWNNPWTVDLDGKVRSAGPDGILNTTDDLIAPRVGPMAQGQTGTLFIRVFDSFGDVLSGTSTTYNYPSSVLVDGEFGASGTQLTFNNYNICVSNPNPISSPPGKISCVTATWSSNANAFEAIGLWPGQHAIDVDGVAQGNCSGNPISNTPQLFTYGTGQTAYVNDCTNMHGHAIAYVLGGGAATINVRMIQ